MEVEESNLRGALDVQLTIKSHNSRKDLIP